MELWKMEYYAGKISRLFSGRKRAASEPTRRPRGRGRDDDESDYEEEDEPRGRGRRRAPSRSSQTRGRSRPGSRRSTATRGRIDFGDEEDLDTDSDEDADEPGHAPARSKKRRQQSLLNLCTPLFGYAAVLPRDPGDTHPAYPAFRQEVMTGLQRIEKDAPDHGIDREDAKVAAYALACFLDEQVNVSQWTGKGQWSAEPLAIILYQDPEGGVNFFRRLESLGDRQKAAKAVFLVCLAFGFRGRYMELPPAQQISQIGDIRQKILRDIHPKEMERLRALFPDANVPAIPIESDGPTASRWWLWASLGVVVVAIVVWFVLFSFAGPPKEAVESLKTIATVLAGSWEMLA